MEVRLVEERQSRMWESFVQQTEGTIAWQSYGWSDILRRHYPIQFYPLATIDRGRITGVLPLYRLGSGRNGGNLISVPFAVAGGIAAECAEARKALLEAAVALARREGVRTITLKQYKQRLDGELSTDENYYNRELDLSASLDVIWQGLDEGVREMISRTEGERLSVEYPSDDSVIYYRMLLRHLHARGTPCVSRRWIEDLVGSNMYAIALLRKGKEVVAGTLVKEFKKTVSFPFTCICSSTGDAGIYAYRLYWNLLGRFASEGFEIFHSGRIPNNDATDAYRLGWGGSRHGYFYQYYPGGAVRTEYATKRGARRRMFEMCWRKVPLPLAGALL